MSADPNEIEGDGERSGEDGPDSDSKSLPERTRCSMSAS